MDTGKLSFLVILPVVVLLITAGVYFSTGYNARVVRELENNPTGERAAQVMLITFPDGRRTPVNYLREGDTVYAGSDFAWWKKIASDGSRLKLLIKGEEVHGLATVSDDMDYTYHVFKRLRPNAPTWASKLVGARLIVISLDNRQDQEQQ